MGKKSCASYAQRRLHASGNEAELDKIMQEECRRKAAKKLPATLLCADFKFPTNLSAEQCTSDALAQLHAQWIEEGTRVADLTCGLGIDCFHIARKAREVTAIDIDPIVAGAVERNAQVLGLENITALCTDCRDWLNTCGDNSYDVIFIDPGRRGESGRRLYSLEECQPDVTVMMEKMLAVAPTAIVKMSPMLDTDHILYHLPNVSELHIVGTRDECKELVGICRRHPLPDPIVTVDITGLKPVSMTRSHIAAATEYAVKIEVGDYIGEPYPAAAKSRFDLSGTPLGPNTSLWLNPGDDFPGKVYKITRIEPFSSSTIKRLSREKLEGSVAVKNLPITAAELGKRLKVTESSTQRIIGAATSSQGNLLLFVGQK